MTIFDMNDTGEGGGKKDRLISSEEAYALDIGTVRHWYKEYVNPGVENILHTFAFGEDLVTSAQGVWINFKNGERKVFDATGGMGVLNLGHNHPRILQARIRFQQMNRMEVHKAIFSQYTATLSHNLSLLFDKRLQYSFFCNSGAEAVDGAIKTAYKYHNGKRKHILHSNISYHGKLLGSGSITASNEINFKFPSIPGTHPYIFNSIDSIRQKVSELKTADGLSDIYAIVVEPYSISTLTPCDDEFLRQLRVLCDEHNIVLIFDEIFSGWYKMGPLFYFMKSGVYPDILTVSKTMGGGKASISAFISAPDIFKTAYGSVSHAFLHSSTYNGFGEECITAIEAINVMLEEDFAGKTKYMDQTIRTWLQHLKSKYPARIVSWSGSGSLFALRLNVVPGIIGAISGYIPVSFLDDGLFINKIEAAAFCDFLFRKYDIHTLFGGQREIVIMFSPAVVVSESDLDQALAKMEDAIHTFSINDMALFAARKFKKAIF